MASYEHNTETDDVGKRWALAHNLTSQLEAAARENPELDIEDRRNLSIVINYLALLAVGLAAPQARGVLARMTRILSSTDVKRARAVGFVSKALRSDDPDTAASNLVFWLWAKVDKSFGALKVAEVAALLREPGRKGPVGIIASLGKLVGFDGPAGDNAKTYDNARRDLKNRT